MRRSLREPTTAAMATTKKAPNAAVRTAATWTFLSSLRSVTVSVSGPCSASMVLSGVLSSSSSSPLLATRLTTVASVVVEVVVVVSVVKTSSTTWISLGRAVVLVVVEVVVVTISVVVVLGASGSKELLRP